VNTLAARSALAAVALALALSAVTAPAAARRHDTPDPLATPTLQPLYAIGSPPPTVMQASAADVCANDAFLAYRTVPMPFQNEVTVCGTVIDAATSPPVRGVSHASFLLDVDGSDPIAVVADGSSAVAAHPGDIAVVRGRYHRENGGAEGIDETHSGASGRGWAFDGYAMLNGTIYH
jgi:hypothetical protein